MARNEQLTYDVQTIGTVAGYIWHDLKKNGPMSLSKLARHINAPRDLVMQGVGWLAREGKVTFHEGTRSRVISLT